MFCPKCGTENPEIGKFCRSCGTDLSGVSKALNQKTPSENEELLGKKSDLWGDMDWGSSDDEGEKHPKTPEDVYSSGVQSSIMGVGFLVVSMVLFFTGVAGGHRWWWALLFPAFFSLANGISQIAKAKRLDKKQTNASPVMQNQIPQSPASFNLPPTQTEYAKPQGSIYDTGDLVAPPSVTEHTTKHLEMNSEGETMTLPKK